LRKTLPFTTAAVLFLFCCCTVVFVLMCGCCFVSGDRSVQVADGASRVEVPINVSSGSSVAGVEIAFKCSEGLSFVSFELSAGAAFSSRTPVVEKNGVITLGIFNADNRLVPVAGQLGVGFLVFEYRGDKDQTVNILQIKLVEVIDKDTTRSVVFDAETVQISRGRTLVDSAVGNGGVADKETSSSGGLDNAVENSHKSAGVDSGVNDDGTAGKDVASNGGFDVKSEDSHKNAEMLAGLVVGVVVVCVGFIVLCRRRVV